MSSSKINIENCFVTNFHEGFNSQMQKNEYSRNNHSDMGREQIVLDVATLNPMDGKVLEMGGSDLTG
jgi:hypothetical protein